MFNSYEFRLEDFEKNFCFKLAKKLSAVNTFRLFLQNEKNKIFYHKKKAKKK